MTMTPERAELIHEGERHEKLLTNGHRGDAGAMSDALGYLIRVTRTQLFSEYITLKEFSEHIVRCPNSKPRFGWPAFSAVLTIVIAATGLILKFN